MAIFLVVEADRHYGPHPEFFVSKWGLPLGRYSRTAYATNLLAVQHPIPGTYGDRPYSIDVDMVEFQDEVQEPDASALLTDWPGNGAEYVFN